MQQSLFYCTAQKKNKGKMAHFRSLQEPESIKGKTSYKSVVGRGENSASDVVAGKT